jgi:hypothetical protein
MFADVPQKHRCPRPDDMTSRPGSHYLNYDVERKLVGLRRSGRRVKFCTIVHTHIFRVNFILDTKICRQTDWSRGDTLCLYSGSAGLESRPRTRYPDTFFIVFLSHYSDAGLILRLGHAS